MAYETPGNQRPIGSRKHDVRPPVLGDEPSPKRRGGLVRRLVSVVLLVAAVALIGGLGYAAWSFTSGSDVKAGTPVKVVIPKGATSEQIAAILADKDVITHASVFRARLKLNGDGDGFRSGTYTLKTGSSYDTIIRKLEQGPAAAPTFDITLPEGMRLEETAAHIDSIRDELQRAGSEVRPVFTGAEYLKAVAASPIPVDLKAPKGTKSREGLLFPATYQMRLDASAEDFVAKQAQAMADNLAGIDMSKAAKANLTPYDVIIIASLIEREAKLPKERPLVSAVIWNRLKVGEPLGIDASNQYAAYKKGAEEFWVSALLQSQLDAEGPYNLRKVAGLPPTPIAAPSLASLQAAAAPADVDYRYYVANPDGSGEHFFTASYDEFLAHPFQGG